MDTKQKLITLSLILGTTGLCLFLLEKMNIVKGKLFNYIGKGLIVVGVYLLAIGSIITSENYDQLPDNENILLFDQDFNLLIDNSYINNTFDDISNTINSLTNQLKTADKNNTTIANTITTSINKNIQGITEDNDNLANNSVKNKQKVIIYDANKMCILEEGKGTPCKKTTIGDITKKAQSTQLQFYQP